MDNASPEAIKLSRELYETNLECSDDQVGEELWSIGCGPREDLGSYEQAMIARRTVSMAILPRCR